MYVRYDLERDETWMALIWVQGGTEMLFWNFDRSDLSPGWRWVEIIETWRDMNVSPPSRSRLTFMRVPKTASRVHPGPIWNPSRYHYVCHVCHRYFHSCPASPASMSPPPPPCTVSHPSMSRNSSIHVATRSWCWHLTSIHFMSHMHPGQENCSSAHPSSTATYPGLKMCVSAQSRPHRTPKTQYLHSISTQK